MTAEAVMRVSVWVTLLLLRAWACNLEQRVGSGVSALRFARGAQIEIGAHGALEASALQRELAAAITLDIGVDGRSAFEQRSEGSANFLIYGLPVGLEKLRSSTKELLLGERGQRCFHLEVSEEVVVASEGALVRSQELR